ncbi:MAG TPA: Na+/H+ antiporter NhaA [Steroidobacteraceae bacterium]|nr:Na+/H+ antiporter NhaA [Steroidobacteraceae bacterium]
MAGAIFIALAVGKPVGIVAFCWLAVRTGVATRPAELSWRVMAGGSALAGIGFTMSLFIAGRAFRTGLIDSAKLGIFAASVLSAALGLATLAWAMRERDLLPDRSST